MAKASKHYKVKPYFWTLSNVDSPQTMDAGLCSSSVDGLVVKAGGSEDYDRGSFGIKEEDAIK